MSVSNQDILKITFEVTLDDGSIAQNVHYMRAQLLTPMAEAQILAGIELWIEAAYGELSAELLASMTQNVCTVDVVEFSIADGIWKVVQLVGYFTPTITFNNATEGLPNQSSAFATFQTARPRSVGRTFLMPFGEDRQANTYLIAAALGDMADFADEILDSVVLAALEYLIPGIPRAASDVFLDFTGAVVTNVLGSQRRRRPGVGA